MHHADPLGVSHPRRGGMILESNTGKLGLLTRAAFMHHGDQRHDALVHYFVCGLYKEIPTFIANALHDIKNHSSIFNYFR